MVTVTSDSEIVISSPLSANGVVPKLKKFPPGVTEISHSQKYNGCTSLQMVGQPNPKS